MATVVVTFTDTAQGSVACSVEFTPTLKREEDATPAQAMAVAAVTSLKGTRKLTAVDAVYIDHGEDA